jgi:hypothetical protein
MPRRDLVRPKKLNFMPKLFPAGALAVDKRPIMTFEDVDGSGSNTSFYSFSNVNIGEEHPTREIYVLVFWRSSSGAGRFVTGSSTINGVGVTNDVSAETSGQSNEEGVDLVRAAVPTGTSVTIDISMSGGCLDCDIAVFRSINVLTPTPFDTASAYDGAGTDTLLVDVERGGLVIAGALLSSITSATWTGINETFDQSGAGSQYGITGGFQHRLPAETNRSIQVSAGTDKPWVVASYR